MGDKMDWTKDPFAGLSQAADRYAGTVLETRTERHQRLLAALQPVPADDRCKCEYVEMYGVLTRVVVEAGECPVHCDEPPDYKVPEDPDASWPGWLDE